MPGEGRSSHINQLHICFHQLGLGLGIEIRQFWSRIENEQW